MKLRRRLLIYSAPVVVAVLILVVKLASVAVAGNAAVRHFAQGDVAALAGDVDTLRVLNIVEPAKAHYAAGTLAVLQNRLDAADREFTEALQRTEHAQSCAVRVNLALVRESRGDAAAAVFEAPAGCVGDDTAARLEAKIAAVSAPVPPSAPAPPVSAPLPPISGSAPSARAPRILEPGRGDPLEKLQQILRDAATR